MLAGSQRLQGGHGTMLLAAMMMMMAAMMVAMEAAIEATLVMLLMSFQMTARQTQPSITFIAELLTVLKRAYLLLEFWHVPACSHHAQRWPSQVPAH